MLALANNNRQIKSGVNRIPPAESFFELLK
jgi:hypothetical protein